MIKPGLLLHFLLVLSKACLHIYTTTAPITQFSAVLALLQTIVKSGLAGLATERCSALCWIRDFPVSVILLKTFSGKLICSRRVHFVDDLDKCINLHILGNFFFFLFSYYYLDFYRSNFFFVFWSKLCKVQKCPKNSFMICFIA